IHPPSSPSVRGVVERLGLRVDVGCSLPELRLFELTNGGVDTLALSGLEEIRVSSQSLACREQYALGLHALLDEAPLFEILFAVPEGGEHLFSAFLGGGPVARLALDFLLAARRQLLGGHAQEAAGVDGEGDLESRDPRRHRWDASQDELREGPAVGRELTFSL